MNLQLATYEGLRARCRIPGTIGYRPAADQSVWCIASEIVHAFSGVRSSVLYPGKRGLILIAVDAVGFDFTADLLEVDQLFPLTSTFPTTSATAWVSVNTGMTPVEHGVVGVMYVNHGFMYRSDLDMIAVGEVAPGNLEEPYVENREGWYGLRWSAAHGAIPAPRWKTVFTSLAAMGIPCEAVIGDLVTMATRKNQAIVRGATVRANRDVDWPGLRLAPVDMVRRTIDDVSAVVAQRRERRFIWGFCNLDDYVHRVGYDGNVERALLELGESCRRWAEAGWTVAMVSDHGAVPVSSEDALLRRWAELTGPNLCRLPPGGAGRVRWCYPRPGNEEELVAMLREALGTDALVVYSDWLGSAGLVEAAPGRPWSIGDVVVLAVGPRFPGPVPSSRFEHGSFTWDEIVVPLAIWRD